MFPDMQAWALEKLQAAYARRHGYAAVWRADDSVVTYSLVAGTLTQKTYRPGTCSILQDTASQHIDPIHGVADAHVQVRLAQERHMLTITLDDGRVFPCYDGQPLSWDIGVYFIPSEAPIYPKARAVIVAMKEQRPAQLARERRELRQGSFDRTFGKNAAQLLKFIDNTMAGMSTVVTPPHTPRPA